MLFYISGPMRGVHNYNFAMFDRAAALLESQSHEYFSPADHDREVGFVIENAGAVMMTDRFDIHEAMRWDLARVAESDAILLLPEWENSSGVASELAVAKACGLEVYHVYPKRDGTLMMYHEPKTHIIGVAGYAQVGKDTLGEALVESGEAERLAFADALKAVLYDLNPLVDVMGTATEELRAIVDDQGWEWAKTHTDARELLQRLGVAARDHIDPDVWLNAVMRQVQPGGSYIITDVRYPNEAAAIKKAGGQLWRIWRPGVGPANTHGSETALDHWEYDQIIHNEGTIDDLKKTVENL